MTSIEEVYRHAESIGVVHAQIDEIVSDLGRFAAQIAALREEAVLRAGQIAGLGEGSEQLGTLAAILYGAADADSGAFADTQNVLTDVQQGLVQYRQDT